MAKKTKSNTPLSERTNIAIYEKYYLKTKFQKRALVPYEAIDQSWMDIWCYNEADHNLKNSAIFVTTDNIRVTIKIISCCNNSRQDNFSWLQNMADFIYGLKFEVLQRNWQSRLGNLCGYWYVIDMEEVI